MKRKISIYLQDILTHIALADSFLSGKTFDEFALDTKDQYAVIRCIEIIGEAVKNVPPSMRDRYPDIPWKALAGMRDKVIHSYFGVSVKTIWLTVTEDFPGIQKQIQQIFIEVEKEEQSESDSFDFFSDTKT
jgi:uncharacterized protein with HEPN domain